MLASPTASFVANAAEFAPFRTTGIESWVELRYRFDEDTNRAGGAESFNSRQSTFEEEISVLTHNYVIHPNFMKLDLGAGVSFFQDSIDTDGENNDTSDDSYSLLARARLLEKKPYPISLYYTRDNPSTPPGLGEASQHTVTAYGFDFGLLEPLVPFRFNLLGSHQESEGFSTTRRIDESSDKAGFRLSKHYNGNYSQRLNYDYTEDRSASGSLALPITSSLRTTEVLTYSSDWRFGERRQLSYHDRASVTRQEGAVDIDETRFTPQLLWEHSDEMQSNYSYNYLDSRQNVFETTSHSAGAGIRYRLNEHTSLNGGASWSDSSTTDVDEQSVGANGRVTHRRAVGNGKLTLVAGFDYQENERDDETGQASVIDEIITLEGLTPTPLAREFIITSSIVVFNLDRTQTFVEGTDYRVIVVGNRTEIQRLAGSSITDPEQVAVDYAYQTGGQFVFTERGQNYALTLSLGSYYDFYLRYLENEQRLVSGTPTLPLNSSDSLEIGASVDYPVNDWIGAGADFDWIRHDEDISSFDSLRYSVFGRFILGESSSLTLSAGQKIIDNTGSAEDTDLTNFSLMFRSQPFDRMILSVQAFTEKDTGGTIDRQNDVFKFTAQWNAYRLVTRAEAFVSSEQTGSSEKEDARFMLTVRRNI